MTKVANRLRRWRANPEIIGQAECPLILRWTILGDRQQGVYRWPIKLVVHYFVPGTEDPDAHDHPRSFVTFVVRGHYVDRAHDGAVEVMRRGMLRYRRADHAHTTTSGPSGCWTVCLMGRQTREWGFWRDGAWLPFRVYAARYGRGSLRC